MSRRGKAPWQPFQGALARTVRVPALQLLFVGAVVVLGHRQLLSPLAFKTQDHIDGYARVVDYLDEWRNGHWAQTLPHAFLGAGHAFPRYYPPLSPSAAAALTAVVSDPIRATHVSVLAALVLGGIFMTILVRRLTGSASLGVAAGIAYALYPYTFVQTQARGAFAEAWAAAWYPLVLFGAVSSARAGRLLLSYPAAIALLLLSHTVMALWVLPALLLIAILSDDRRAAATRHAIIAGVLGLGLATFHLVSVASGVSGIRAADPAVLRVGASDVAAANVAYGAGTLAPLLFPVVIIMTIAFAWRAFKFRGTAPVDHLAVFSLVAGFLFAALIVAPSDIWNWIPQQWRYIQFSARLHSPTGLFLILGLALYGRKVVPRAPPGLFPVLGLAVVLVAWVAGRSSLVPRTYDQAVLQRIIVSDYSIRGFTVDQEYLPRGVEPRDLVERIVAVSNNLGRPPLIAWTTAGPDPVADIDLEADGQVTLPLVAYDFLMPKLDEGVAVPMSSNYGLLTIRLPGGRHRVIVHRVLPPALIAGMAISLATLVILSLITLRPRSWSLDPVQ